MIGEIKKDLIEDISQNRYQHTLRVVETCKKLSKIYGADLIKTEIAALLHDSAKFSCEEKIFNKARELDALDDEIYIYNKDIIHAPLASKIAKDKYNIQDEDILNAIKYHTTGRKNMSLLEKVIFIGDFIEPSRNFDGIGKIRNLAFVDLDKSLLLALNTNLKFLLKKEKLISRDTIEARNYLMMREIDEKEIGK